MTLDQAVREAMELNRCAVFARRHGKLPITVRAFCERRDYLIRLARSA